MKKRSCSACGAPIAVDSEQCEYCGSYYDIERPVRGNRTKGKPIDDWCMCTGGASGFYGGGGGGTYGKAYFGITFPEPIPTEETR